MFRKKIKLSFIMVVLMSLIFIQTATSQSDNKEFKIRTGVNVSH